MVNIPYFCIKLHTILSNEHAITVLMSRHYHTENLL